MKKTFNEGQLVRLQLSLVDKKNPLGIQLAQDFRIGRVKVLLQTEDLKLDGCKQFFRLLLLLT